MEKVIIIEKTVIRCNYIKEYELKNYCDRHNYDYDEVLQKIREGDIDYTIEETLSYLTTEEEICYKIHKEEI